jgi:hypothetical protein
MLIIYFIKSSEFGEGGGWQKRLIGAEVETSLNKNISIRRLGNCFPGVEGRYFSSLGKEEDFSQHQEFKNWLQLYCEEETVPVGLEI